MTLPDILGSLGLSRQAAEIYQYILAQKRAPARQIASALSLTRPTAYDHLKVLVQKGLVVEREIENKKVFSPEEPEAVLRLLEEEKRRLEEGKASFEKLLPELKKGEGGTEPKIKFYSGKECFRQVLTEVLVEEPDELFALWPFADMTEAIGEEYLQSFTKRRIREGIRVRAIWPAQNTRKALIIPAEETRLAPKGHAWRMGSLIYGDKVSFIASKGERFCFTVTSREFAELMRAQFAMVWGLSRRA